MAASVDAGMISGGEHIARDNPYHEMISDEEQSIPSPSRSPFSVADPKFTARGERVRLGLIRVLAINYC
jgi:hypothetical protein